MAKKIKGVKGGDSRTNLNYLAVEITLAEGLKQSVNIGQVKEILRITLKLLKQMSVEELSTLLNRVK